jgi:uncharacterized low-complexity protein
MQAGNHNGRRCLPELFRAALLVSLYWRIKTMWKKTVKTPLAAAIGAAFVTSLAGASAANANADPFAMTPLASGYSLVADNMEGKCGNPEMAKAQEGKCGASEKETSVTKGGEGKCGSQEKQNATRKGSEGKCGSM